MKPHYAARLGNACASAAQRQRVGGGGGGGSDGEKAKAAGNSLPILFSCARSQYWGAKIAYS